MAKLFDLARMTTATTGTGTITLGSAATGYLSFSGAGVADQDIVAYGISDGANSEVGYGTYTATGTTLTRNVTASTNSGAAISLSGNAQVFIIARAEDLIRAPVHPCGRLTLTSGTPVLTASATAQTTVYYTPYLGSYVPLWDGKSWAPYTFSELSQATTDTTKSPAAVAASSVYDMFVWLDGTTLRCTRGPAWTNTTTRGYTLTLQDGHYLNPSSITNGPAALRGLYVGTIASNASSQIDMQFGVNANPATAASFGVWNRYNKVRFPLVVNYTNTSSWTYNSTTYRAVNAGVGLQMTFVAGLQEDTVQADYGAVCATSAAAGGSIAIIALGYDSNTASAGSCLPASINNAASTSFTGFEKTSLIDWQKVGVHTISAIEKSGFASDTVTFNSLGAASSLFLATFTG